MGKKTKKIQILAICGKSGSGKDFIKEYVTDVQKIKPVKKIISYTTRPKREYETDGFDYNFISEAQFKEMKDAGAFLETSYFNNWWYGTCIQDLSYDALNVGIFDPTGIKNLRSNPNINIIIIYMWAEDSVRMRRIFNREKNVNVPEACRRYFADEEDFKNFFKENSYFNIHTINNNVEESFEPLKEVNNILFTTE